MVSLVWFHSLTLLFSWLGGKCVPSAWLGWNRSWCSLGSVCHRNKRCCQRYGIYKKTVVCSGLFPDELSSDLGRILWISIYNIYTKYTQTYIYSLFYLSHMIHINICIQIYINTYILYIIYQSIILYMVIILYIIYVITYIWFYICKVYIKYVGGGVSFPVFCWKIYGLQSTTLSRKSNSSPVSVCPLSTIG